MYALLRSKNSNEHNYIKNLNNNINNDNIDNKISAKINNIRLQLSKLDKILTNSDSKEITKGLYKIEEKLHITDRNRKLRKTQKERIYNRLIELFNKLDKKDTHKYGDYDDLDYHGIRDIENSFNFIDPDEHFKPTLVKRSFNGDYEEYRIRGDKNKDLSLAQYIYTIHHI